MEEEFVIPTSGEDLHNGTSSTPWNVQGTAGADISAEDIEDIATGRTIDITEGLQMCSL